MHRPKAWCCEGVLVGAVEGGVLGAGRWARSVAVGGRGVWVSVDDVEFRFPC